MLRIKLYYLFYVHEQNKFAFLFKAIFLSMKILKYKVI